MEKQNNRQERDNLSREERHQQSQNENVSNQNPQDGSQWDNYRNRSLSSNSGSEGRQESSENRSIEEDASLERER
jgi:hypothetical protein